MPNGQSTGPVKCAKKCPTPDWATGTVETVPETLPIADVGDLYSKVEGYMTTPSMGRSYLMERERMAWLRQEFYNRSPCGGPNQLVNLAKIKQCIKDQCPDNPDKEDCKCVDNFEGSDPIAIGDFELGLIRDCQGDPDYNTIMEIIYMGGSQQYGECCVTAQV